MTVEQILQAIRQESPIRVIGDSVCWGVPVSLSDDQSGVYYRPRGANAVSAAYGTLSFAMLKDVESK